MPATERLIDRADRNAKRSLTTIGDELREARITAALSQSTVGDRIGVSHAEIGRIERGIAPWVPLPTLVRFGLIVGLDVKLAAYPTGAPLRDVAHISLLERVHGLLGHGLRWRTEVALPIPGDRRAFDALISGADWDLPVEAELRLRDMQALDRRLALKRRDAGYEHMLLVVAATRTNRDVLAAAGGALNASFPIPSWQVSRALKAGQYPGGSGLLMI